MHSLPTPHGDKLRALIENPKLPRSDRSRVRSAISRYRRWLNQLRRASQTPDVLIDRMVSQLNDYKKYIDLDLVFDSNNDFLYRQKGQLKLDNTIIEEFLPILVTSVFSSQLKALAVSVGPVNAFSALRFESSITADPHGGGMTIRSKDQDFAISRKLFLRASHRSSFKEAVTEETNITYIAAEIKTNLDKTMFQEAAATALDVKSVVPRARYYLLCEWLDMTPISTTTTAIDEVDPKIRTGG